MAANKPNVLVGTAPEASYWLLRSEDDDTEQPVDCLLYTSPISSELCLSYF